jgi:hypothetical protein
MIAIIAMALGFARRRDLTFEAKFISEAKNEAADIEMIRNRVYEARNLLIERIRDFAIQIKENYSGDISRDLIVLISAIKAFLVTSEYFDDEFSYKINGLAQKRSCEGLITSVNLIPSTTRTNSSSIAIDAVIDAIEEVSRDKDVVLTISYAITFEVQVTALDGVQLPTFSLKSENIVVRTS